MESNSEGHPIPIGSMAPTNQTTVLQASMNGQVSGTNGTLDQLQQIQIQQQIQYQMQQQQLQMQIQQHIQQQQEQLEMQQQEQLQMQQQGQLQMQQQHSTQQTKQHNPMTDQRPVDTLAINNTSKWQVVQSKRIKRLNTKSNRNRTNAKTVPTTQTQATTNNKYQSLQMSEDEEPIEDSNAAQREPKPPPIFVPGITHINPLIQTIETQIHKTEYYYKMIDQEQVKIMPKTAASYKILVEHFKANNIAFHTYQLKSERAYRAVLRYVHPTMDITAVEQELKGLGHEPIQIINIRHRVTKKPLALFYVDLKLKENNRDIYNIEFLQNAKIKFEPPRKKKDIPQCKRCQMYGHTQTYCTRPYRCVKCAGDHATQICKKDRKTKATCALCSDEHPANYKGCAIYREIQRKKFPANRQRQPPQGQNTSSNPPIEVQTQQLNQPSTSYARIAHNNKQKMQDDNNTNMQTLANIMQQSFDRLEQIMIRQAEDMRTLLNLLTVLVTKTK